jgi:hypothetical protein
MIALAAARYLISNSDWHFAIRNCGQRLMAFVAFVVDPEKAIRHNKIFGPKKPPNFLEKATNGLKATG